MCVINSLVLLCRCGGCRFVVGSSYVIVSSTLVGIFIFFVNAIKCQTNKGEEHYHQDKNMRLGPAGFTGTLAGCKMVKAGVRSCTRATAF